MIAVVLHGAGASVTEPVTGAHGADDAKLLNMVRAGDSGAFAQLYQRHQAAARRLARELVRTSTEVDDAVAETFARVLDVTRRGGGPTDAFRPYMLTVLRRVCYDRLRAQRAQVPTDAGRMPDQGEAFSDPAVAELDSSLIVRAFLSLPERWRAVLWHTEIEDESPAEVGPVFGLSRNAVAALKLRAREGLRQAYLQMHIARVNRQECRPVAGRLGAFVRDELSKRDTSMVTEHLAGCADCRAACAELTDVNAALRGVVAPIFLGTAAASYLSGGSRGAAAGSAAAGGGTAASRAGAAAARAGAAGHGAAAGATAVPAASHAAVVGGGQAGAGAGETAGTTTSQFSALSRLRYGPWRWVAGGVAIVVASAGLAWGITLDGSHSPQRPPGNGHHAVALQPDQVKTLGPSPTTSPRSSARPTHSPKPARRPTPATGHTAAPKPTHTTTPLKAPPPPKPSPSSPPFTLAATINVFGGHHQHAQVFFTVTDTGSKGTGQLTASITLPAGSSLPTGQGGAGWGGWSCQPDSNGATCQHGPIAAGQQTQDGIFITINGQNSPACGQPVEIAVSSDSVSASAQSPQDIQCNGGNG
jgi:RNA polymerase sigma factor (sigma-70 family)